MDIAKIIREFQAIFGITATERKWLTDQITAALPPAQEWNAPEGEMMNREWAISFDNEAGPGWDYVVVIPGYENIMGLAKEVAERIVDDHNAARRQEWQDISTAPKDGVTQVLASHWSGRRCDWVHDARFTGRSWMSGMIGLIPTHWMPLPAPPVAVIADHHHTQETKT